MDYNYTYVINWSFYYCAIHKLGFKTFFNKNHRNHIKTTGKRLKHYANVYISCCNVYFS